MTLPGTKIWHAKLVLFIFLGMAKEMTYSEIVCSYGIVKGTDSHLITKLVFLWRSRF